MEIRTKDKINIVIKTKGKNQQKQYERIKSENINKNRMRAEF